MADIPFGTQPAASSEKVAAGTSFIEGLTGLAAIALAVIALAGVFPRILLSIATIALGAALLFEAGSVAARFSALMAESVNVATGSYQVSRWGGMTTGFLSGVAGIALGILSLLAIYPMVLVPIAVIAFGVAMIMDSGVNARLSALETEVAGFTGISKEVVRESAATSTGIQVIAGLSAVTLGILSLVGINPMALSLVGILTVGAALLMSGTIVGTKMVSMFRS